MKTAVKNKIQRYEAYKPSGVEWLGEIPEHWEIRRLKYVFKILKRIAGELGYDVLSITQKGIKIKDISSGSGQLSMDYSKYQLVFSGDFAMNHMDLLTGFVDLSQYDGVISPDYRVFNISNSNYDKNYLLVLLQLGYQSKVFYAHGQGVSMLGRWRFPADNFNNFIFPIPPLEEQTAIAQFLDDKTTKIDEAIAIKEKQINLLKERKQILIHKAVTRGIRPLSEVEMKDSGIEWIGEIPEHWEVKRLKYFTKIQGGFAFNSNDFKDEGVQIIKIANTYMNQLSLDRQPTFVDKSYLKSHIDWVVSKNDILMSLTGTLGKKDYGFAILIRDETKFLLNQRVAKISAKNGFEVEYLLLLLQSDSYQNQLYCLPAGTKQANLSNDNVINIKMPIPSKAERAKISDYIKTASQKTETAISLKQQEIEKLKEYKSSLINSAVTGKLRVPSVQEIKVN